MAESLGVHGLFSVTFLPPIYFLYRKSKDLALTLNGGEISVPLHVNYRYILTNHLSAQLGASTGAICVFHHIHLRSNALDLF